MSRSTPQSFTPDQERAISAQEREVLVIAPAGSGKTEVLTQRVIRILKQSAGDSFRLLVLAFTMKAVQELRERTSQSVADEFWRVDVNTIHGFALDWLRRYGREIGVSHDVVVLSDDTDRVTIVADYLRSIGLNDELGEDVGSAVRPLLNAIDACRTQLYDEKFMHRISDSSFGIEIGELLDAYEAALRVRGAIDFPGMLVGLHRLVNKDNWVLEHFRTLYQDILVDEGQDLTPVQSSLLSTLAGDKVNLFVVADSRQLIRGYAGGSFENAQDLVPVAARDPLYLRHNFNGASEILCAADAILNGVDKGIKNTLSQLNMPLGRVRLVPNKSNEMEANFVTYWVRDLVENGLYSDSLIQGEDDSIRADDIAVIGRNRIALAPIVTAFVECGMKHAIQTEAKIFLPESEARIFIDCLAFGIDKSNLQIARRVLDELHEWTGANTSEDPLIMLNDILSLRHVAELVALGLEEGSSLEFAMDKLADIGETNGWGDSAHALAEVWKNYRRLASVQDPSVREYLWHLEKTQRIRPNDPGVRLLTIDQVRGLEFKAIAIIGACEGMIPHYHSVSDKEINGERRRLYVAMTRASRELVISWPMTTVDRYGRSHNQRPSRFLVEAGLVADATP